jgi:hypothetical protein
MPPPRSSEQERGEGVPRAISARPRPRPRRKSAPYVQPDAPLPDVRRVVTRSYGWQIAATDASVLGGSVALFLGGLKPAGVLAVVGYPLDGAIVHLVHDNPGRAFASLGLRVGVPMHAAILGVLIAGGQDNRLAAFYGGAAIGGLAALVLDPLLLAYEQVVVIEKSARFPMTITPSFSVSQGGANVGLGGTF